MTTQAQSQKLDRFVSNDYPHGFVTELEADSLTPGLSEAVVRHISAKKMSQTSCYSGV